MRSLFRHPLFGAGLLIRLLLILTVVPYAASNWYVPFVESSLSHFSLDPWRTYLANGGVGLAFPYGYVMWLALLPEALVLKILGANGLLAYGLSIMLAEVSLLLVLKRLISCSDEMLLSSFWLSPIVIFAGYWLGLNDVIPVLVLMMSMLYIRQNHALMAGLLCGAAISAKLSMLLAVPLFGIYLYQNRGLRYMLKPYIGGLIAAVLFFGLPFLLSPEAMGMLLNNPEMGKVYQLVIPIGKDQDIFVLPMVYFLALYVAWRVRRISFELFFVLLGVVFFLVVLLTPAAPGWIMWVAPLLVYFQATGGRKTIGLVTLFTLLYLGVALLATPQPLLFGTDVPTRFSENLHLLLGMRGESLLHTGLMVLGMILVVRLWRETVNRNDYFRISRKPLVLGIAGNRNAGKVTLVKSLEGLFGSHSAVHLRSEDYRLWDKNKPMWQVLTQLNPRANDLERFAEDVIALADGRAIHARRYDDGSGLLSKPQKTPSNDFILISGVHAFYQPLLRRRFDLTVFLDLDEDVRQFFSRNDRSLGVASSVLEAAESKDYERFVAPQAEFADLVLTVKSIHVGILNEAGDRHPPRFKLHVRSSVNLYEEALIRVLVGVCGLHVDIVLGEDANRIELVIEGEVSAEDIELAVQQLMPSIQGVLDVNPVWQGGVKGLMQLIVLSHINQALRRRFL
jgi:uridine kinase